MLRISETDLFDEQQARSRLNDGWQTVHRLLRGKYVYLVIFALGLGITGGVFGYRRGQRAYTSTGVIRVIPVLPRVLGNDDEEHGAMPMFESFAETQASLVTSRTVVDAALHEPQWIKAHGQPTDGELLAFMRSISAERKLELIYVRYTDASPDVALANVTAVINEYQKLYQELDARSDETRMNVLKEMQASLTKQSADVQRQITVLNDAVGSDNIRAAYDAKQTYLRELDSKLQDTELELAQLGDVGLRARTLHAHRDSLLLMREGVRAELNTLGKQNAQLTKLTEQADALRTNLDELRRRVDRLQVESPASGRVEIITAGERPLGAEKDSRISRAAMGGLGGVSIAALLVLLTGLFDSRMRLPQDLPSKLRGTTVLGMLPRLPKDLADPARAAAAAHCVQQIRTMVQVWCASRNKKVLTISSADSGSGKTTLTMALGVSCAAAGCRTLLIDCDLVGVELTRSFKAIVRRKIGTFLRRQGIVPAADLASAVETARNSNQLLGDVLVARGHLTPQELQKTLQWQERHQVGLLDALSGDPLDECVAQTMLPDLDVLPVGSATPAYASTLSQGALRKLLAEASEKYDLVLIDTGPMPGSIEAAVAATASDGVILAVSSGEKRATLNRTLSHLSSLSCEVAGVVFNRVRRSEEALLSSSTRSTETLAAAIPSDFKDTRLTEAGCLGPIERAVMSSVPEQCLNSAAD